MYPTNQRGFIALMSVIVISAILLVLMFTLGLSSFFNRFDTLDAENKRVSLGLAEACVNAGILKLAQSDYNPATVVVDSSDPAKYCKVCSIDPSGIIVTRAVYRGAYTDLSAKVDTASPTYDLTGWSETPTSANPGCILP